MGTQACALLALWNDVDPALDAEYEEWHAREHVPERLTVPGMTWGLRWRRLGDESPWPRYLTLYGLRDAQVLDSPEYRRLLAEPTPWSRAMRPALRNVTRWVCAIDVQTGIERFERAAVRTVGRGASMPEPRTGGALLAATRVPEAAELPWLAGGQARAIEGERIEVLAYGADDALPPGWREATRYARLPIG